MASKDLLEEAASHLKFAGSESFTVRLIPRSRSTEERQPNPEVSGRHLVALTSLAATAIHSSLTNLPIRTTQPYLAAVIGSTGPVPFLWVESTVFCKPS